MSAVGGAVTARQEYDRSREIASEPLPFGKASLRWWEKCVGQAVKDGRISDDASAAIKTAFGLMQFSNEYADDVYPAHMTTGEWAACSERTATRGYAVLKDAGYIECRHRFVEDQDVVTVSPSGPQPPAPSSRRVRGTSNETRFTLPADDLDRVHELRNNARQRTRATRAAATGSSAGHSRATHPPERRSPAPAPEPDPSVDFAAEAALRTAAGQWWDCLGAPVRSSFLDEHPPPDLPGFVEGSGLLRSHAVNSMVALIKSDRVLAIRWFSKAGDGLSPPTANSPPTL